MVNGAFSIIFDEVDMSPAKIAEAFFYKKQSCPKYAIVAAKQVCKEKKYIGFVIISKIRQVGNSFSHTTDNDRSTTTSPLSYDQECGMHYNEFGTENIWLERKQFLAFLLTCMCASRRTPALTVDADHFFVCGMY